MTYSFTEKKRIRKSFAKRASVLDVPYLLATQLQSSRISCRRYRSREAEERRPAGRVSPRFSRSFPFRQCAPRVRQLHAGRAGLRRDRMPAARPDLCVVAARPGAPGHHGSRSTGYGQGSQGAGSLHGRNSAHDDQRLLRHQRYRAGHRFPVAPLAGRLLRARPRQDPQLGQAAVLGAHHSLPRFLAGFRVRSRRTPVLPRRPSPQDAGHDAAQGHRHVVRRKSWPVLRIRHLPAGKDKVEFTLVPERLRGEVARFDFVAPSGKVIVAKDKRITAKHIRDIAAAGI
jgi:DNA-directed RNA polymerase subunit beta